MLPVSSALLLLNILTHVIIFTDHNHDNCAEGVRFHMADTYLSELESVSAGQLGPKHTITFLQPWVDMLSGLKRYVSN